jgi:hypothetical protein
MEYRTMTKKKNKAERKADKAEYNSEVYLPTDEGTERTIQALGLLRPGQSLTYAIGIPTGKRPAKPVMEKARELYLSGKATLTQRVFGHPGAADGRTVDYIIIGKDGEPVIEKEDGDRPMPVSRRPQGRIRPRLRPHKVRCSSGATS